MNLSIIGSSRIVEEHIKAAKKLNINIKYIYSSKVNSKNLSKLSDKYKLKKILDFEKFCELVKKEKSNILIAGRIQDNQFYIEKFLKNKNKIFIEKPVFNDSVKFKKYLKFNSKFFVGFNRIFYKNVKYLVNNNSVNLKNLEISCICPEKNNERIITNTSHVISVFFYLFKNLKILNKNKFGDRIFVRLKANNNTYINLIILYNAMSNFEIYMYSKKFKMEFKTLELLKIYSHLEKKIVRNNNFYKLIEKKKIDEFSDSFVKPGIYNQMKEFKEFCSKRKKILNDMNFAYKVVKLTELIS